MITGISLSVRRAALIGGMRKQKQREAPAMLAYRMYFRASGKIRGREDFEADDDVAAIRIARVLYDACSDVCDCFELWRGARHIRAQQPHHQEARLADLIEAHQRVTIETEERLREGNLTLAKSQRLIEAVDRSRTTARYK